MVHEERKYDWLMSFLVRRDQELNKSPGKKSIRLARLPDM